MSCFQKASWLYHWLLGGRDGSDLASSDLMAKPTPNMRCSSSLLSNIFCILRQIYICGINFTTELIMWLLLWIPQQQMFCNWPSFCWCQHQPLIISGYFFVFFPIPNIPGTLSYPVSASPANNDGIYYLHIGSDIVSSYVYLLFVQRSTVVSSFNLW